VLRFAQLSHQHVGRTPRKYARKWIVMPPDLLPHRDGEVSEWSVRDPEALIAADDAQLRQLLRSLDRQAPQSYRVQQLNTAVFAPMPSASVSTATIVKPGLFTNPRTA
jgi:hypothetical protein